MSGCKQTTPSSYLTTTCLCKFLRVCFFLLRFLSSVLHIGFLARLGSPYGARRHPEVEQTRLRGGGIPATLLQVHRRSRGTCAHPLFYIICRPQAASLRWTASCCPPSGGTDSQARASQHALPSLPRISGACKYCAARPFMRTCA